MKGHAAVATALACYDHDITRENPGPAHTDTGHEREFEIPWEERERKSLPPTPT